ncbi:hypothetical protein HKX48_000512 [Thoreauomyces humboldtii]|nr:hypothetical protein HKX48_000512 [Thoreauomyces humboldtii]
MTPIVEFLGNIPAVRTMFSAAQPISGLINHDVVAEFGNLKVTHSLDTVICISTAWRPGYNASNNPGLADAEASLGYPSTNLTYAYYAWLNALTNPSDLNATLYSVIDAADFSTQSVYLMDAETNIPYLSNPAPSTVPQYPIPYPFSPIIPGTGAMQLGLIPAAPKPFWAYNSANNGLTLGLVIQQFWSTARPAPANPPTYACMAGLQIFTTWINMMRDAKPISTAVVAMFESEKLTILSSSEWIVNNTASTASGGVVTYGTPIRDSLTPGFETAMQNRFLAAFTGDPAAVVAADPSFELDVLGTTWIINVDLVALGTYNYALLMLAVPRSEVYGPIDKARKRAQALSIGISIAAAIFIAGVFVIVVLPLSALVNQMTLLTKFDFGSLETSGQLDKRSWIWELRQVQIVFSTMVKAFAGAIAANKKIMYQGGRSNPPGTVSSTAATKPMYTSKLELRKSTKSLFGGNAGGGGTEDLASTSQKEL